MVEDQSSIPSASAHSQAEWRFPLQDGQPRLFLILIESLNLSFSVTLGRTFSDH